MPHRRVVAPTVAVPQAAPTAPPPASQPAASSPPAAAPAPAPAADHATAREGQTITIDVLGNDGGGPLQLASVDSPAHGSAVALGASVVYSAPSVFLGADTFRYTVVGSGGATASATVTVDVLPVNHAPRFTPGGDVSVLEDSAGYASPWAAAIDAGPGDGRQAVRFIVTAARPDLFSSQPQVASDGTLSFVPAADANGTTQVEVTAVDDGGSANGGADRSTAVALTIDVRPVNDPPSFTGGGDVGTVEGAGPQARLWATGITPGPANEADQHVSFATSVGNPSLFTVGGQPAVDPAGVLSFTPRPFASGTTTVSVVATDDGGTANGGRDTASATFTIMITHVNQPPRFTGAGNLTVAEDSGAQVSQWATSIDAGAPDESGQTVTFAAADDNPALFAVQPALDGNGRLTYTPAANANGSATVTVTAQDDGGTAGGGHDTTTASFTITVMPVNDAPSFTGAGAQSVLEDAGAQSVQWATAISPGPGNESAQTVAFSTSNDDNALFSVQPAVGSSGVLSYTPAANANGSATVTVTAQDDGGTANGGARHDDRELHDHGHAGQRRTVVHRRGCAVGPGGRGRAERAVGDRDLARSRQRVGADGCLLDLERRQRALQRAAGGRLVGRVVLHAGCERERVGDGDRDRAGRRRHRERRRRQHDEHVHDHGHAGQRRTDDRGDRRSGGQRRRRHPERQRDDVHDRPGQRERAVADDHDHHRPSGVLRPRRPAHRGHEREPDVHAVARSRRRRHGHRHRAGQRRYRQRW